MPTPILTGYLLPHDGKQELMEMLSACRGLMDATEYFAAVVMESTDPQELRSQATLIANATRTIHGQLAALSGWLDQLTPLSMAMPSDNVM